MTSTHQQILNTLAGKSSNKQAIYDNTVRHFESIKGILRGMAHAWGDEMQKEIRGWRLNTRTKTNLNAVSNFRGIPWAS